MATNAYAPYPPEIVGNSWVPIVEDPFIPQTRNEQGYWFNLSASATPVTSRIYVAEDATHFSSSSIPVTSIYPENGLDWGPVKSLEIPCFGVTAVDVGDTITVFSNSVPTTPVGALYSANQNAYINILGTSSSTIGVYLNFNVTAFSAQLTGKRILKVELAHLSFGWEVSQGQPYVAVQYASNNGTGTGSSAGNLEEFVSSNTANFNAPALLEIPLATFAYTTATSSETSGDRLPFNYTSLARFDPTTTLAQRLAIRLLLNSTQAGGVDIADSFNLGYAALKVTYCNETRVGIGGRSAAMLTPQYGFGPKGTAFSMPILNTAYSAAPVLTAGNYYVTLDSYPPPSSSSTPPPLRALRQLYTQPYPGIHGVEIPITTTPTEASVAEQSNLIPAISLHTSTAVIADSHGYGQQLLAPVYTGVNASQDILNAALANGTSYPMARFYARRFGATSSPLGLRLQSSSTVVASIGVDEFDALDEVADGWKQVDLTFTTMPTFNTSGNSTFEWFSSTPAGAQWQVLGATSPNVTGFNFAEVGPQHWLGPTTYGGITQVSTWDQGTGTATIDREGDITLMFATVPQMDGLEAAEASVDLEYLEECDRAPGAIPTAVDYIYLSWNGSSADVLGDTFSRTAVSGWGTADTGQAWSVAVGANIYAVTGTTGTATPAAPATSYIITSAYSAMNTMVTTTVTPSAVMSSQANVYIVLRYADANNHYLARVSFETDGRVGTSLNKRVAGVDSSITSLTYPGVTYDAGVPIHFKAQLTGSLLQLKVWSGDDGEPPAWATVGTDTSLTAAGLVGMRFQMGATGPTFAVDDLVASNGFGALELQREDDYTDWQTIMLATSPLVTDFNDYEARVGVESRYRIRVCHELDFCGEWSDEAAYTLTAPGVSGTDIADSVMIFTSNARQDGSSILAYVEAFDGTPAEQFAMFEASEVTLQPMYNRNYRVAFHGAERGGQQFSRNILLNNAGVTIINFEQAGQALRNLAWESTPYVAVRDGHGSRWLANVMVPQLTIQPPRHALQYAQVTITEVTDTAWPVNP